MDTVMHTGKMLSENEDGRLQAEEWSLEQILPSALGGD